MDGSELEGKEGFEEVMRGLLEHGGFVLLRGEASVEGHCVFPAVIAVEVVAGSVQRMEIAISDVGAAKLATEWSALGSVSGDLVALKI